MFGVLVVGFLIVGVVRDSVKSIGFGVSRLGLV